MPVDERTAEAKARSRAAWRFLELFYEDADERGRLSIEQVEKALGLTRPQADRVIRLAIKRGHVEKVRVRPHGWQSKRPPHVITAEGEAALKRQAERRAAYEIAEHLDRGTLP